jgi:hypothetical protein
MENFQLTFSSDDEFETFDREFLQQQKAAEERMKREKLDEEFARSFQENSGPSSMNPPALQIASAFDRLSGVRPRPSNPKSSLSQICKSEPRKLTWSTPSSRPMGPASIKSEPRSMAPGVKFETSSSSYGGFASYASPQNKSAPSFKAELSSSKPMPGSFREVTVVDSDSDVEIIPASEYYDNSRPVSTLNRNKASSSNMYGTRPNVERPRFSPEAQIAGNATLRRLDQSSSNDAMQRAMFGKQQASKPWMNSTNPAPGPTLNPFGSGPQSLAGPSGRASGYVYPNAYSNGMGGMGGMGRLNAIPGAYPGSMQTNIPSLGYVLNNVPGTVAGFGMSQAGPSISIPSSPQNSSSDELDNLIRRAGNNYDEIADYLKLNGSMTNQLDYIMNDPRKTNQEIKELLENIRPDVDLPPEDREGTPEGLVYPLVSLQLFDAKLIIC